jgi:selT/selW/selH-like putative selenoprotein
MKGPIISIEYCVVCNYQPRAASLAAEIRTRFPDAEIKMIPSKGGRFEIMRDGIPVYEKSKTGRHAKPGEILSLLETNT